MNELNEGPQLVELGVYFSVAFQPWSLRRRLRWQMYMVSPSYIPVPTRRHGYSRSSPTKDGNLRSVQEDWSCVCYDAARSGSACVGVLLFLVCHIDIFELTWAQGWLFSLYVVYHQLLWVQRLPRRSRQWHHRFQRKKWHRGKVTSESTESR